jgi:hypothetical protein
MRTSPRTITLHQDTVAIVTEEAEAFGVTFDEAANFLIRFGIPHKPMMCERDELLLDSEGQSLHKGRSYFA